MCKGYKKINYFQLSDEDFELKEFFRTLSLSESRTMFAIKTNMVKSKMNYMSDPMFSKEMWRCEICNMQCSTEHITVCSKYKRLRTNIDWSSDKEVVKYFQSVIKLREEDDKNVRNHIYTD